jgi:hypothetical protein
MQCRQEGRIDPAQDFSFMLDYYLFPVLGDEGFLNEFQCIEPAVVDFARHEDPAEPAKPNTS